MNSYRKFVALAVTSFLVIVIIGVSDTLIEGMLAGSILEDISHLISFLSYFVMLAAWGISVHRRILHRRIYACTMAIHSLLMLWLFLRELKLHYVSAPTAIRYLWYAFYIPMILIPLFAYWAARHVGMVKERHGSTIFERILFGIAFGLIMMVMTNDLHQFVFRMDGLTDAQAYTRGPGYYLVTVWIIVLELGMIWLVLKRCKDHILGIKKYLPLVFVLLSGAYCMVYILTPFRYIELLAAFGWLTVMLWESCVLLGMIPVNDRHEDFFRYGTIHGQIVDENGKIFLQSDVENQLVLNEVLFRALKSNGILHYGHDTQLHIYPLKAGYMIWQEDISSISELLDEIRSQQKDMMEKKTLEERELQAQVHKNSIEESTRIYTLINEQMEEGITRINYLADQMKREMVPTRRRKLLFLINLTGVFLKRRSNIIMMDEGGESLSKEEVELCLSELGKNLKPYGIESSFLVQVNRSFTRFEIIACLDQLEQVLVGNIDQFRKLTVVISDLSVYLRLQIMDPDFRSLEYLFSKEGIMI